MYPGPMTFRRPQPPRAHVVALVRADGRAYLAVARRDETPTVLGVTDHPDDPTTIMSRLNGACVAFDCHSVHVTPPDAEIDTGHPQIRTRVVDLPDVEGETPAARAARLALAVAEELPPPVPEPTPWQRRERALRERWLRMIFW